MFTADPEKLAIFSQPIDKLIEGELSTLAVNALRAVNATHFTHLLRALEGYYHIRNFGDLAAYKVRKIVSDCGFHTFGYSQSFDDRISHLSDEQRQLPVSTYPLVASTLVDYGYERLVHLSIDDLAQHWRETPWHYQHYNLEVALVTASYALQVYIPVPSEEDVITSPKPTVLLYGDQESGWIKQVGIRQGMEPRAQSVVHYRKRNNRLTIVATTAWYVYTQIDIGEAFNRDMINEAVARRLGLRQVNCPIRTLQPSSLPAIEEIEHEWWQIRALCTVWTNNPLEK
jgi:hypothetical protein